MSHTVTVATQIKNEAAVQRACQILKLEQATRGKFRLFSEQVEGLGIQLPGWKYMAVANTQTGELKFDNYGGSWGRMEELHKFQQRYALEAAKMQAEQDGQVCSAEYEDKQGRICFDIEEAAPVGQTIHVGEGSDNDGPKFAL